ncbi:MAG: PDZ domain-containing protein [Planctomycetes bacterium]|nr:PDZ domain-containing protein [Planctomycetota bacterium]
MRVRWLLLSLFLILPVFAPANEPKKVEPKAGLVPFRLTDTHHTLVRVKINGKGPFNFIVDTGCPVLLIAEPVGEKAGLKTEKGWATLDTLDLEGGFQLKKVKARVETPFQIKGMNSMGLAGVELHGLMGYTVLAKYKMEFDYTKKQMAWTPLNFEPPPPMPLGKAAKEASGGGMDFMVAAIEILTMFAGIGPAPPPQPRGFFGFELEERDDSVYVTRVLAKSPAAEAGLKAGDRILMAQGKDVVAINHLRVHTDKLVKGKTLEMTIEREKKKQDLKITAGEGL